MKKRGISLIVLIITIIVIIILAAVVILTLSKNNPIDSAKEARFKEDVRTFQDELALAVSKEYANSGGHRDEKITTSDFEKIKEYIPSFSEKYKDKFVIENDNIFCINVLDKEMLWCKDLNVNLLYTKLEYLESTGTQYINSKIKTTYNTGCTMDCMLLEDSNGYGFIGYNRRAIINNWSYTRHYSYDIFDYGDKRILINAKTSLNTRYKISFGNGYMSIPELNVHSTGNKSDKIPNDEIILFGSYWNNEEVLCRKMRIYELCLYEQETLICNFIPVLDQNNKPALYDKVEGKFYYNQGTGEDFKYKLKE